MIMSLKKIAAVILLLLMSGTIVSARTLAPESQYKDVKFHDFNLELDVDKASRKVKAHWDDFPSGEGFKWYKLLYSTTNSSPTYPEQSAIFVGTQRTSQLNHYFYLKGSETHYVRICAITDEDTE